MQTYPTVFRERALQAMDAGRPREEVARVFGVSPSSLTRWRRRQRIGGSVTPTVRPGRRPRIGVAQEPALRAQVAAHADATLAEHCARWEGTMGVRVSVATMSRRLRRLGLPLKKRR